MREEIRRLAGAPDSAALISDVPRSCATTPCRSRHPVGAGYGVTEPTHFWFDASGMLDNGNFSEACCLPTRGGVEAAL